MNISNDISSFKGFALQSVRDTVKESGKLAHKAYKGDDLSQLQAKHSSTMNRAVKAFKKAANKLELRGVHVSA